MKKTLFLLVTILLLATNRAAAIDVTPIANLTNVEVTFTNSEDFGNAIKDAVLNANTGTVPTQGINLVIKLADDATFTADDVKTIKANAGYTKVAGVDLSNIAGLTVTQGMFSGWDYFSKIVLPEGAFEDNVIPKEAFRGCSNLIELTVGTETNSFTGITEVQNNAFTNAFSNGANRDAKVSLAFPDCTKVGNGAFQSTAQLASVTLSPNVEAIGGYAFQNSGIETFPVNPDNTALKTINGNTFQNCASLTTVTIPNGVTTIGGTAFESCTELTTLTLGKAVTSMEVNATTNCPKLTAFVVDKDNTSFSTVGGFLLNKAGTEIIRCPQGLTGDGYLTDDFVNVTTIKQNAFQGSSLTKLTLSANITTIEQSAFPNSAIQEIVINDNLTTIDERAFDNAKNLQAFSGGQDAVANEYTTQDGILYKNGADGNIKTLVRVPEGMTQEEFATAMANWPETLTELAPASFRECTNLTTITLPDNIKTFGTHTFAGCTGLTTITLPRDLEEFGDAPFQFCTGLTTVELGENKNFTKEDGIIYGNQDHNGNPAKTLYLFPAGLNNANPTIAPDTKIIAAEAFAYSTHIEEIKVPQGVHTLEAGCFHNTSAQTIIIPHSVVHVAGADVFRGCRYLTTIYWLPEKLLGYNYNVTQEKYTSNLFYEADLTKINIYVSNEYTDTHEALGTGSLVDLYSQAKGNDVGANKGYGDCKSVSGVYHRALTEDSSAAATLGNGNGERTNPTYTNKTSVNDYTFLTLYRDFSKPEGEADNAEPYYTLVLPVSLTAAEVTATFGEGTEIYHFAGREEKTLNFSTATTVIAGEPFVIRPKNRETAYLLDLRNSTPAAVAVDNDTNATGNGKVVENCPVEDGNYTYSFKATYQQDAEVPAYSYYVSNEVAEQDGDYYGVVKYLTKAGKFRKALRGYIYCPNEQKEELDPAKGISFMSFNGVATSIADIHFEGAPTRQQTGVYTLSGQQVRTNGTNLEGLPKGIYVVNGKKTIVK